MGLGLSICRSIIEAHGGRLWTKPNEPRGTIFYFAVPSPKMPLERRRRPRAPVSGRCRKLFCRSVY